MDKRIEIIQGDITRIPVDAIVNAANSSLLGGGGVDGAIHRAGGKQILEACQAVRAKQGGCNVGDAVITVAGHLPAKYVIHTVGPHWRPGGNNEDALLANCYINCLRLAEDNHINTLSFPNISTGIYRFPKQKAAEIALKTITRSLINHHNIEKIIIVCFEEENYDIYKALEKNHYC
ncbi:O-acetyl-ADP-ribose deacetylase [Erwinia tasmaniensis]|uniref:O-acetyl-ADP-ribose deacetylase n=1 Tax=Erwinia tasmaniensis TaxID=338565 RepID=UPI003A4E22BD